MEEHRSTFERSSFSGPSELDTLLDRVAVAVYSIGADGLCTHVNATALRLFGYSADECIGRNLRDLLHLPGTDVAHYSAEELLPGQPRPGETQPLRFEEVLWTKAGEPVEVECSSTPILEDGVLQGAVMTLVDLRPSKRAERSLRSSEAEQREVMRQRDATARIENEIAVEAIQHQRELARRLEQAAATQLRDQTELLMTVAKTAPVGIAVYDSEYRIIWHNTWYGNFLNAERSGNLVGRNIFELGQRSDQTRAIFDAVRTTGESFSAQEFPLERSGGGMTYWRWSLSRLANGQLMSVSVDVTDQVNVRTETEQIYRNAPIALALVDAQDFTIRRANQQQADILGLPLDELVGKKMDDVFAVPEVMNLFRDAASGHAVTNQVAGGELPEHSGRMRYWSLNLFPVCDKHGRVEAISAGGTEITAQKRAEDALVENNRLAAVGRLAASISHEINNPLESVTNLLYLLQQDRQMSAESKEYASLAMEELGRVSQIASQTLRFHRQAKAPSLLTPQLLLAPVIALYQGKLHQTKARIERHHRDDEPILCFEGEARQVLNNLIDNALDAMPDGGTVTVRTRRARHPCTGIAGIRITVADTGTGMSQQLADRIFEPFYTTKGVSGSGLGLWISSTIAQRHGGSLRVRSSQRPHRRGTAFSLFLPQLEMALAA